MPTATILRTTDRTWSGIISALLSWRDLTDADAFWAMDEVVRAIDSGQAAATLESWLAATRRQR
ncbi:hypothetical protein [Kribbella alba]|uniref:hypothetical protein n=1 Tax=Kribbella alba TaxID=190197 RepID=UPI0031D8B130